MRRNILIVERELGRREALRTLLERAGYTVEARASGSPASQWPENQRPWDLVVLGDREALPWLRHPREVRGNVPVVVLTGSESVERVGELLAAGARGVLTTPVSFAEARSVIAVAMGGS